MFQVVVGMMKFVGDEVMFILFTILVVVSNDVDAIFAERG